MNKWHKFHSQFSPIQAGAVDQGSSQTRADWFRVANENATINGTKIMDFRGLYNDFATDEDVKQFFKEVILKDSDNEINKDQVADYLMTAFHQGGLMYPVSASMSNMLHKEAGLQAWASSSERELRISTTRTGFKVQEIYTSKQMALIDERNATDELKKYVELNNNDIMIKPGPNKDYVVKAGACIDVDFTKSADNPAITVESNSISYGNDAVKSALDKRTVGEIIVDFFRKVFGLNSVKDISPPVVADTIVSNPSSVVEKDEPDISSSEQSKLG